MIDDALLEDVLLRAAEAIDPPIDGPARIVAARGDFKPPVDPYRRAARRRTWAVAGAVASGVAIVVSIAVAAGTSGPTASKSSASRPATGASTAGAAQPNIHSSASPPATGTQVSPNQVPNLSSRVVKTGTVNLSVPQGKLESTMAELADLLTTDGGFVASSDTNVATNGEAPYGDITLRVPVANFDDLVNRVQKVGTATSVTTSGQDVTAQYVDLQARIQSLADARSQFEQIMSRAQSIADLLSVEQQISDLQTQIEQLQGQLQVMTDQTTYSTLTVHVTEQSKNQAAIAPPRKSGLSKAWARAQRSFTHGFEALIGALGGIAVFLMFVALIGIAARVGWVLVRKRLI
jgi:Domain of unknown function (DUF4349)